MVRFLLSLFFKEADDTPPGITDKEKMLALKDAYLIDNFSKYKKRRIAASMKTIATKLAADDRDTINFYRGMMYADQKDLENMKKAHEQFVKERDNVWKDDRTLKVN